MNAEVWQYDAVPVFVCTGPSLGSDASVKGMCVDVCVCECVCVMFCNNGQRMRWCGFG